MKVLTFIFLMVGLVACGSSGGGGSGNYVDVAGNYKIVSSDCFFVPVGSYFNVEQNGANLSISFNEGVWVPVESGYATPAETPASYDDQASEDGGDEPYYVFEFDESSIRSATVSEAGLISLDIQYSTYSFNCSGNYAEESTALTCNTGDYECSFSISKVSADAVQMPVEGDYGSSGGGSVSEAGDAADEDEDVSTDTSGCGCYK